MAKRNTMSQSAVMKSLAESNELTLKQVKKLFADLRELCVKEINPKSRAAPGVFVIPGIGRVKTRKRPARKARKGINPFTKEETMFKARPASNVVKILPVKALKDEVK
jgi:nucleoid DNA-binding protein